MAQHIGIVGCSSEGAALCYRTICLEAAEEMGEYNHPEITMHTPSFLKYYEGISTGDWERVAALMLRSTEIVARAGADFAMSPDNTIHEAFDLVMRDSPIPWLHIADTVGEEARNRGIIRLGVLGTEYLMTGPVYPERLEKYEITCEIPDEEDRANIQKIIFKELVKGVFSEKSRQYMNTVVEKFRERGCGGVVLGCTEIPLLVDPDDCPLPTLDSTRLLARASLRKALGNTIK
ncbi:MAG: amino acid racemase [Deltaproteobacteria bacterium]|nr:amino acid racemase [Deltaproteobacteria bacterium]